MSATGVFTPDFLLRNQALSWFDKLLLSQILYLCDNKEGVCRAKNPYFSDLFGVGEIYISKQLGNLKKEGYILIDLNKKTDDREIRPTDLLAKTETPSEPVSQNGNRSPKAKVPVSQNGKSLLAKLETPSLPVSQTGNTPPDLLAKLETGTSETADLLAKTERAVSQIGNICFPKRKELLAKLETPYIVERSRERIKEKIKERNSTVTVLPLVALASVVELNASVDSPTPDEPESPLPVVPPPEPAKKPKVVYGDGELQKTCRAYFLQNPELYPAEMYTDFLLYWTAPVINGRKTDIGRERWRTEKAWLLAGRLSTWNKKNLNTPIHAITQTNHQRRTEPVKSGGFGKL